MANPNGVGGFKKGQSGNPGGLTREARAFRDLMNADLETDDMRTAWREGYRKAMQEGNHFVLVDYANRKLGKPAETVNMNTTSENPAAPLTTEQLLEIAKAVKP
jgi:hypothetical protein